MKLIDGKKIAKEITNRVKKEVALLPMPPGLAVFLVGDDEASKLYVSLKEKACKEVGIDFHKYLCNKETSEQELLDAIDFLNADDSVQAILIQLPLPKGLNDQKVIDRMDPRKDVDGFHPETLRQFLEGKSDFVPGLSQGIIRLIESTGEDLKGKQALIIANSEVFTKPLIKLLTMKGMKAKASGPDADDIQDKTEQADIIITAVGRPNYLKGEMIKEGAILIDVGTTKEDGKVLGDIDFDSVDEKAAWLTPVPGGVGPVTVAMLLENTAALAKAQMK